MGDIIQIDLVTIVEHSQSSENMNAHTFVKGRRESGHPYCMAFHQVLPICNQIAPVGPVGYW